MAEDTTTAQPVVADANAAAQPAAEAGKDAPDVNELDALLQQYDASVAPAASVAAADPAAETTPPATGQKTDDNLNDRIRVVVEHQEAEIAEKQRKAVKQAIDDAAKAVKGELPDNVASQTIARAWLKDAADNDPRIQKAFLDREKNPDAWNKILAGLSKEFAKEMRRPDAQTTEDREAVTAAVRGASGNPPAVKEPSVSKLSDAELREQTKQKYGYIPHF